MTKLRTVTATFALLALGLIGLACSGNGSDEPTSTPTPPSNDIQVPYAYPANCTQMQQVLIAIHSAQTDGPRTLYVDGNKNKPWQAYCAGMASEAQDFLVVDPSTTFSTAQTATEDVVATRFSRLRINPTTLVVNLNDTTGATTTNWHDVGFADAARAQLPAGFALNGTDASPSAAEIGLSGTGFQFADSIIGAPASVVCAPEAKANSYTLDATHLAIAAGTSGALVFAAEACASQNPRAATSTLQLTLKYAGN